MFANPVATGLTGNAEAFLQGLHAGAAMRRNELNSREIDLNTDEFKQRSMRDNALLAIQQAQEKSRMDQEARDAEFRAWARSRNAADIDAMFADPNTQMVGGGEGGYAPADATGQTPGGVGGMGQPIDQNLPQMPTNLAAAGVGGGGEMMGGGITASGIMDQIAPHRPGESSLVSGFRSMANNGDHVAQQAMMQFMGDPQNKAMLPHVVRAVQTGRLSPKSIGNPMMRMAVEAALKHGDPAEVASAFHAAALEIQRQNEQAARMAELARLKEMDLESRERISEDRTNAANYRTDTAANTSMRNTDVRAVASMYGADKRAETEEKKAQAKAQEQEDKALKIEMGKLALKRLRSGQSKAEGTVEEDFADARTANLVHQEDANISGRSGAKMDKAREAELKTAVEEAEKKMDRAQKVVDSLANPSEQQKRDLEQTTAAYGMAMRNLRRFYNESSSASSDGQNTFTPPQSGAPINPSVWGGSGTKAKSSLDDKTRDAMDAAIDELLKGN